MTIFAQEYNQLPDQKWRAFFIIGTRIMPFLLPINCH